MLADSRATDDLELVSSSLTCSCLSIAPIPPQTLAFDIGTFISLGVGEGRRALLSLVVPFSVGSALCE